MIDRRTFLGASVAASVALSGCLGRDGDANQLTVQGIEVRNSPGDEISVLKPETVTLLDFWATWCAPCKPQMAELRTVREQFPDVHMLSITNENDDEAIEDFWKKYEGTWPVAKDPALETNERFDVTRMPTMLIFDENGDQTWRHVGLSAAGTIADKLDAAKA